MNGFDFLPFASFLVLIFLISGRIIYLKKNGIAVSSGKAKRKKSLFILYFFFALILLLWFFEISKPAFQLSISVLPEPVTNFLINSIVFKITGAVMVSIALVFLLMTLLDFKKSLRFGLNKNNRAQLITQGIFSITRNPFFISLDIYFIGIALLLPNPFFIGFSIVTLISIHFYILKEEKFMRKNYGKEYENYRRKVRRYF